MQSEACNKTGAESSAVIHKTQAIVGLDFVDENGVRHFSLQICRRRNGRFEAIAHLQVQYGQDGIPFSAFSAIDSFKHSRKAVDRLASVYMRRSVPQRFSIQ